MEFTVWLRAPCVLYLQNLLNIAIRNALIPQEVVDPLIMQILKQIPLNPERVILDENWRIYLNVPEDIALRILTLSTLLDIDDNRNLVGAELWVSFARCVQVIDEGGEVTYAPATKRKPTDSRKNPDETKARDREAKETGD